MIKISQVLVFRFTTPLVPAYRDVFRTWSNIYNGTLFTKILDSFKLFTIFVKKLYRSCLTGLKIGFWPKVWNIEFSLVPSLEVKQRKYSAGKYVWHRIWKGERSWWNRKQSECLSRSSRPKGSLEKGVMKNFEEFTKKWLSFMIKLNSA